MSAFFGTESVRRPYIRDRTIIDGSEAKELCRAFGVLCVASNGGLCREFNEGIIDVAGMYVVDIGFDSSHEACLKRIDKKERDAIYLRAYEVPRPKGYPFSRYIKMPDC